MHLLYLAEVRCLHPGIQLLQGVTEGVELGRHFVLLEELYIEGLDV